MHADFSIIILAAGQGVRMRSSLPKVLQPIGGQPLIHHLVSTATQLNPHRIVIVHNAATGPSLKESLKSFSGLEWVLQTEQKGTGHAVLQALPQVGEVSRVLILYGDVPLIRRETLQTMLDLPKAQLVLMSLDTPTPAGFGRILRDNQSRVIKIVNEKDASNDEKKITEIWPGICLVEKQTLTAWLPQLKANNQAKEFYLTDIVEFAHQQKIAVETIQPEHTYEGLGVNDKSQLAYLERCYQTAQANMLMQQGVTLMDPQRLEIRGQVSVGHDVSIDINVILAGTVKLGNAVAIESNVVIKNSILHDNVHILANSYIEGADIASGAVVGPFARLRPGTVLGSNARIGNFVELKNAKVGAHSKVNHLSYIGDTKMGERVNVGAGTITCNYDGQSKHETVIESNVFIGSDTQLIAPVRVGEGATIGAGTTIMRDVLSNELIHNQVQHRTVSNWLRPGDKGKKDSNKDPESKFEEKD